MMSRKKRNLTEMKTTSTDETLESCSKRQKLVESVSKSCLIDF